MHEQFVDSNNSTSYDWAESGTKICVFPVGAQEQHSRHLPLNNDATLAEFFGRYIAEEVGAALLPTLPMCSSYEHTGFRGVLSLKPETIMAIVRDTADEMESQGFDTMIIMNGHGGNFSLAPVTRDINRMNRKLKIILCFPFIGTKKRSALEMHSGAWETSVMLHLTPERVGDDRGDIPEGKWSNGEFERSDLNLFGMGYISPEGMVGNATEATAEIGKEIVDENKANCLAWVQKRLEWLAENRNYCGDGGNLK